MEGFERPSPHDAFKGQVIAGKKALGVAVKAQGALDRGIPLSLFSSAARSTHCLTPLVLHASTV